MKSAYQRDLLVSLHALVEGARKTDIRGDKMETEGRWVGSEGGQEDSTTARNGLIHPLYADHCLGLPGLRAASKFSDSA